MTSPTNHRMPPKGDNWKADHKNFGVLKTAHAQRKALCARSGLPIYCAKCHKATLSPEAEHVYPLWLVDREDYPACLRFWSISNLEFVCQTCHAPKTAREAKARAKIKRILGLTCRGPKRKIASRKAAWPTRKLQSRSFAQARGMG